MTRAGRPEAGRSSRAGRPEAGRSIRRLILLRHGQTEYNATNRMQGQLDTELTELGRSQAKEAARELTGHDPALIVSSDLQRAHDTAAALGDATGLSVATDPRLRETHLGDWQGLTHLDVDDRWPGARQHWRANAIVAPPGGESRVDVAARTVPLVNELLADTTTWDTRPVVLVAHGGTIAALTAALLGLPVDNWPVLGGLANASWVQVAAHESESGPGLSWRLDVWNASARVAGDVL